MAETGLRTNHQSRVDWWRGQFQRQQKANLSVTELCRQLGVSVTTFYYWKKRVHEAFAEIAGAGCRPGTRRVALTTGREFRPCLDRRARRGRGTGDRVDQRLHGTAQGHH